MALAIATNNAALNAAASASSVNRDMETSMARLSSGKRINSASDDAAGVAISSRLSAEIRGTDQAIRNSLDGQALIDTAEGAHKEIENILQRMREVAVQASNDTNNAQDRANLQAEMDAMSTEIDRIAGTTTWAGAQLMDATTSTFSFQVGAATGTQNQIAVTIKTMNTGGLDVEKTDLNLTGTASARYTAIDNVDKAIKSVNDQRSELGAVSNRLNHTVNNLTNISSNLSAAKGGIEDADFALETTSLAKNQILQQASTAMLAQANASKQNVLSLLQG
jgi:flagellin